MTTADNGTNQNSATAFFEAWQDMIRKSTEAWSQAASGFGGFTPPNPGAAPFGAFPFGGFPFGFPPGTGAPGIRSVHAAVQPGRLHADVAADVRILAVAMDEQPSRGKPAAVH